MPYELLTIVANGANGLKNKCCDCFANVMDACIINGLANVTNVLMNDAKVLPT